MGCKDIGIGKSKFVTKTQSQMSFFQPDLVKNDFLFFLLIRF